MNDSFLIQYTEDSLVVGFHSLRQHWDCTATSHVDYHIHNTETVYCDVHWYNSTVDAGF